MGAGDSIRRRGRPVMAASASIQQALIAVGELWRRKVFLKVSDSVRGGGELDIGRLRRRRRLMWAWAWPLG